MVPYFIMLFTNGSLESEQSLCPFKMLTGFPCPGCGITKSLVALYEGDLFKSLYYHIFGLPAFLFCIVAIVILSVELINGKEYFNHILYSQKLAYVLAIMLGTYHFIRLIVFVMTNSLDDILRQSIWR